MKTYIINVQNNFSFKEVIKSLKNWNIKFKKISIDINFVFEIPTKIPTNTHTVKEKLNPHKLGNSQNI